MTVHSGKTYHEGEVSIGAPPSDLLSLVPPGSDVLNNVKHWLTQAKESDTIYYFAIYQRHVPVGQILLHDIDWCVAETLIAYHIFEPRFRGRGIGTLALGLLLQFVVDCTSLTSCVIITSRDNHASRRIAQKCGFVYVGPAREDPENGLVYKWSVPPSSKPH